MSRDSRTLIVAAILERIMNELNTDARAQLLSRHCDTVLTQDLPTFPAVQEPVASIRQSDIVNVSESPGPARPAMERRRLGRRRRLPRPASREACDARMVAGRVRLLPTRGVWGTVRGASGAC